MPLACRTRTRFLSCVSGSVAGVGLPCIDFGGARPVLSGASETHVW